VSEEEINFNNKDHCVDEFAKRWWYALPEWPPADFDYSAMLKANKLRKVDVVRWKMEPEEDELGYKKVYELETFKGVFKDVTGHTYDMRPRESCPSVNNFLKMDKPKLQQLLLRALES